MDTDNTENENHVLKMENFVYKRKMNIDNSLYIVRSELTFTYGEDGCFTSRQTKDSVLNRKLTQAHSNKSKKQKITTEESVKILKKIS